MGFFMIYEAEAVESGIILCPQTQDGSDDVHHFLIKLVR